jgi:hydroxymethylglutaryl-CoA lyase
MIEICEVGPRDGLQNECKMISTDIKAELITRLIAAGIHNIEAVSTQKWSRKWRMLRKY